MSTQFQQQEPVFANNPVLLQAKQISYNLFQNIFLQYKSQEMEINPFLTGRKHITRVTQYCNTPPTHKFQAKAATQTLVIQCQERLKRVSSPLQSLKALSFAKRQEKQQCKYQMISRISSDIQFLTIIKGQDTLFQLLRLSETHLDSKQF